jgi:CheY-like chemotaxis protein
LSNQIHVLLVEDEPLVLLSTQDTLEGGGYTVVTAGDGEEAMALLDARSEELAGLVTDVRMGDGPSGWDVARHARELKPNLPVVYATADSAQDWSAQGVPKSLVVQKPYAPAQLLTAISTLITEAQTGSEF